MTLALSPIHLLRFASTEDRDEFHSYPSDEQASVKALHDAMMRIAAAPNPHQGCAATANCRSGWKAKTLRKLYDEWKDAGRDWRVLVDKRRYPDAREPALPADFRAFIREKFGSNQRKNKPAYRQILRQWERWLASGDPQHAIPGYSECPQPGPCARWPHGWSYKNLNRCAPPPAELVMARIGVHAATALLPQIPGTREGMRFLEWVSGDDVWCDRKCMIVGHGPCRVLQFGVMDYAASYYLKFIQRPLIPRKDGSEEALKRRDFLWLVALFLEEYGFPLDYTMHILCERGTATMSRAEARYLYEVSEGHIVVGYSSMEGEMVHAWEERKAGNSRAKAWHESFHNLFHNEHGDLYGQVGKDRDHSPAALHGRERHALALNNAAMIMTPEQRGRLRLPFPGPAEAYADSLQRVDWINRRQQHECEGFARVMDWRPRGLAITPRAEAELLPWLEQNPAVREAIAVDPDALDRFVEYFPRPETPLERAVRLAQGHRFAKLPSAIWRTFYEDLHEQRRIGDDGSFEFQRDGRTFRFVPPTVEEAIRPGTEVSGFFRPDGSAIHLFGGTDRYLMSWPAERKVGRGVHANAIEKQAAFERKRSFFNAALANVREATHEEVERAQADALVNAQVLAENGIIAPDAAVLADVQPACTSTAAAVQSVVQTRESAAKATRQKRQDDAAAGKRLAKQRAAAAERARALLSSTPVE